MLQVTIPAVESFDEKTNEFISTKEQTLQLEHSLLSLSKWESKWKKPFLSTEQRSYEESVDYIRCMTITQNVSPDIYRFIPPDIVKQVSDYIEDPMTATWFTNSTGSSSQGKKNSEATTSELIYYWMIALNIPMECQKWHLNRLLTLIRVCEIKQEPQKKMSKRDIMSRNKALNEKRRAALHSKG